MHRRQKEVEREDNGDSKSQCQEPFNNITGTCLGFLRVILLSLVSLNSDRLFRRLHHKLNQGVKAVDAKLLADQCLSALILSKISIGLCDLPARQILISLAVLALLGRNNEWPHFIRHFTGRKDLPRQPLHQRPALRPFPQLADPTPYLLEEGENEDLLASGTFLA